MSWLPLLRKIGGTVIFMIGVIALPIPIIPGWFLIGAALYIFSIDSPDIHAYIGKLRMRYKIINYVLMPLDRLLGNPTARIVPRVPSENDVTERSPE